MLMMLPNKMRTLPLDRVFPFDDNDLMVAVSNKVLFGLREIRDDAGKVFSIKGIIESKPECFGKQPISDRNKEFTKVMLTRLERLFLTRKTDYLYFDQEEQEYLQEKIFTDNALTAKVEIYLVEEDALAKIDFDHLTAMEFMRIKKEVAALGAVAVTSPAAYVMMSEKSLHYDRQNNERMKKFRVDKTLEAIFAKYPDMRACKTKKEFDTLYKKIAKQLHPDRNHNISVEEFQEFQEGITYITKKSKWYRGLV